MTRIFPIKSIFARNVLTLASGTAAAQVLTILVAPLLTRLYQPEDYGLLALWSAATSVVALLASGRYEGAILLPKRDAAAIALVYLSVALTLVVSLAVLGVIAIFGPLLAATLGAAQLAPWLLLMPAAMILTNLGQSLSSWANRRETYRIMAWSRIAQALVGTAWSIAAGLAGLGPVGLIGGVFAGQAMGVGILGWQFWKKDHCGYKSVRWVEMKEQARRYADFPKFTLWADLTNVLSNQLVTLLLARMFGIAALGWYSIGQRVIGVPSSLIGSAVSEVFRGRASRDYAENGNCLDIYRKTFKHLVLLSLIPFVLLLVAAPMAFALVFGEKWRPAGEIAQIMSIMYVMRFTVSPLTHTFFLANRQREDLVLHLWILASSTIALWLGYAVSKEVTVTLLCFSLNFANIYLFYLWRSHKFAAGIDK